MFKKNELWASLCFKRFLIWGSTLEMIDVFDFLFVVGSLEIIFAVSFKNLIKIKVPQPWDHAQKMRLDERIRVAGWILL